MAPWVVYLLQAPATLPDLFWLILMAVLGLFLGAVRWIITLERKALADRLIAAELRIVALESWVEDASRFQGEIAEKVRVLRERRN